MTWDGTRPGVRQDCYEKFGRDRLGWRSTALAIDSDKITDVLNIGNLNYGDNELRGKWIYLPGEHGANAVKSAANISGQYLFHADYGSWANLAATANVPYELLHRRLHPDTFNKLIEEALRLLDTRCDEVLTDVADGSMNDPSATAWLAGVAGMGDVTKTNDADLNQSGFWSLYVVNHAANDYAVNATSLKVEPGETRFVSAGVVVQQGGPAILRVYDDTHGVQLASVTATGFAPMRLWTTYSVPTGCYEVRYRLEATAANSILAWDWVASFPLNARYLKLPTYIDQQRRLIDLVEARYDQTVSGNVDTIASKHFRKFQRGVKWDSENRGEDSNPNAIMFYGPEGLPSTDLWLQCMRPWWDTGPLDDEVKVTRAPEDQLRAAVYHVLGQYMATNTRDIGGFWGAVAAQYQNKFNFDVIANVEPDPPPRRALYNFTRGSRGGYRGW